MSVRVRFAPSPTGNLHIGGARTALYNYIFARSQGGKYILRIEDTDAARSTREFEESQISDMNWLGLNHDEGPGCGGEYAPYRQSERMDLYQKYANQLLSEGKAFYDFSTDEELEQMAIKNKEEGTPPYTGRWRNQSSWEEAKAKVSNNEKAPIRFLVMDSDISFKDHVRGEVTFPRGMVGDFVIIRSNGMPTYNFCNVIDDHLHKITHVIRGEDHVNNTLRQVMIYQALGVKVPEFAHVSLLIGEDRQKLSKRHGATSVKQYREEGYLSEALTNYLCLLGWSHPDGKDIFTIEEISDKSIFSLDRFSGSHAIYDIAKLKYINSQHMKKLSLEELHLKASPFIDKESFYHSQPLKWQLAFLELFREKISIFSEFDEKVKDIISEDIEMTDELKDILSWDSTPLIKNYILKELDEIQGTFVSSEIFTSWVDFCKKELKIKGKPLFMGFRGVLTGQNHGADLKVLIPLTPIETLKRRIANL